MIKLKNLIISLIESDDWWSKMSEKDQETYLKQHPNSEKAKELKKKAKKEQPNIDKSKEQLSPEESIKSIDSLIKGIDGANKNVFSTMNKWTPDFVEKNWSSWMGKGKEIADKNDKKYNTFSERVKARMKGIPVTIPGERYQMQNHNLGFNYPSDFVGFLTMYNLVDSENKKALDTEIDGPYITALMNNLEKNNLGNFSNEKDNAINNIVQSLGGEKKEYEKKPESKINLNDAVKDFIQKKREEKKKYLSDIENMNPESFVNLKNLKYDKHNFFGISTKENLPKKEVTSNNEAADGILSNNFIGTERGYGRMDAETAIMYKIIRGKLSDSSKSELDGLTENQLSKMIDKILMYNVNDAKLEFRVASEAIKKQLDPNWSPPEKLPFRISPSKTNWDKLVKQYHIRSEKEKEVTKKKQDQQQSQKPQTNGLTDTEIEKITQRAGSGSDLLDHISSSTIKKIAKSVDPDSYESGTDPWEILNNNAPDPGEMLDLIQSELGPDKTAKIFRDTPYVKDEIDELKLKNMIKLIKRK